MLRKDGLQANTRIREALLTSKSKLAQLTKLQDDIIAIAAKDPVSMNADDRRLFETVQGLFRYFCCSER